MSNSATHKIPFRPIDYQKWQATPWKKRFGIIYDLLMMGLIIANLASLFIHLTIKSSYISGFIQFLTENKYIHHWADFAQLEVLRQDYIVWANPIVDKIDNIFISYLVVELFVRWAMAIFSKQYQRWWFFPFAHWYEVLAIIPYLRFLRLLRAVIIVYRLRQDGHQVLPAKLLAQSKFYYDVVMEELTDRIVLTVLSQVERELKTSTTHQDLVHRIIEQHRTLFADALAASLQQSLTSVLTAQQQTIRENIGQIVHRAIDNTPELTQLLKLMPFVGNLIEQQIQAIGQRLGENISQGILEPFIAPARSQTANPLLSEIATQVSQVQINSEKVDTLVASVVQDALQGIREQVKIKHWQQHLEQHDAISKSRD